MGQMYYRANDGTVVPISANTASPIQEGLDPATGANRMFFYDTDATTAQYTQRGKQIEFRIVGTLSAAWASGHTITITGSYQVA